MKMAISCITLTSCRTDISPACRFIIIHGQLGLVSLNCFTMFQMYTSVDAHDVAKKSGRPLEKRG